MKLLRRFIGMIIFLILLSIIGIVFVVRFVDPNKFKPLLIAEVAKRTDYRLVIDGDLSWSFYPKLGVNVAHMTLFAPQQSAPFLDAKEATMMMGLSSLLSGTQKLSGSITIQQLKLMQINAQHATVGVHWQDNVLTLQPVTADLYDGKLEGVAHGREFATEPRWDWSVKLNHVQVKPLLIDLNGPDAKLKLSGVAQMNLQATTQGETKEKILRNLNGAMQFSLKNGILEGIDLNYFVQMADALINKQPLTLPNSNKTNFDSLTGSAVIQNGVATTQDLLLTTPAFTTQGAGDIDLTKQTLDYQLQIIPLHATKIKWAVPLLISGDWHRPSIRLDMITLNALIAKEQLEKVGKKMQEEIKKLPEKVDKFLQKFLDQ